MSAGAKAHSPIGPTGPTGPTGAGSRLFGPLISTDDLSAHLGTFTEVFGLVEEGRTRLDAAAARALFGPAVDGAELVALRTPGVDAGVLLADFRPGSAETVRDESTWIHRDVLRVVDFYAADFAAAVAHARALGCEIEGSEAEYEGEDAGFREAHLRLPDHVVAAFLGAPADFFADFVQVRDRLASEVVSISLPLTEGAATVAFLEQVLGWSVVYELTFDDPSFSELLGAGEQLRVTARMVGPARNQPYLNLVDYGLPADAGGSLAGRAVAPRRGLLGAVVATTDLDGVRRRAQAAAGPAVTLDLAAFGSTRACRVELPTGVGLLVVEAG
ncbi:hypothetical protein [Nocardioides pantholopis]|uniref:hypothetical protein n=1 Tax=Nocardioides pantholopis TaxID=2483798 RepID=UPI0013DD9485|nr:hypothetical protein [Nocardioides pantholopis]